MLAEFDQNTLANMTAALDSVCKKIPADKDTHDVRKRIGDAMIQSANSGRREFSDFQQAGLKALEEATRPAKSNWLGWIF